MPEIIEISNEKVGLGELANISLQIARLPTYTDIDLPVRILRGEEDGPVLLLTGGLHGDEINGIEIIRRLLANNQLTPERGTVIALPLVNVYGFLQNVRGLPDGKDINRSFPGSKTGSLARLVAHTLMNEIIPQIDYGIDFHTGGASRTNFPQLRCTFDIDQNLELAKAFAPPVILHSSLIDKTFRKAAHKKGKHILVYETGESHRYDEQGIREGMNGILRVMKHLGMRKNAPQPNSIEVYSRSTWIRAHYSGLFLSKIGIGDHVGKRQVLGKITDPFGYESFSVKAPREGRVIGLNNNPVINKGDALIHLAIQRKELI